MNKFSWVILFTFFCEYSIAQLNQYKIDGVAQGTTYSITYYSEHNPISKNHIDSILNDIDLSMSTYKPNSLISRFNNIDNHSITVDYYMRDVLECSFKMYKMSKGLFDITVSPLVSLWGFGPKKSSSTPDSSLVAKTLEVVGMDKLKFKKGKLYKKLKGVTIDLNGIAQGYTADVLSAFLTSKGIDNSIVEIGGEIVTKGVKPNGEQFKVAIARPDEQLISKKYILSLSNKAVTTSANYEQYKIHNGVKRSHHINPKTGYPTDKNIISVTVVADSAMEADAFDNVFITMQVDEALRFVNARKKIDIYLIYEEQGIVKEAYSNGFLNYVK